MNLKFRKAASLDFDAIFRMGFDVWGKGSEADYMENCRASAKYARGEWYVLEAAGGELVSSLIVYALSAGHYGIGSLATSLKARNNGYASQLIVDVLVMLERETPKAIVFLYSDINPKFYERFNFEKIPACAQRYKITTCMVRGKNPAAFTTQQQTPEYF